MLVWLDAPWDYALFCATAVAALGAVSAITNRARGRAWTDLMAWLLLCVMLVVGAGWVDGEADTARARMRDMVRGIAPTYALEFERAGHAQLRSDAPPDDPLYLSLIQRQIEWLRANPSVNDIYTFRLTADGGVVLIVDSETDYDRDGRLTGPREARTPIGEAYDADDVLRAALHGEARFEDEPYQDRWGTWVSAYQPLRDAQGHTEAVLGVDFSGAAWTAAVNLARQRTIAVLALLAATLIASTAMVGWMDVHARRQRAAARELAKARDAAEAASRTKSAFLANMSHEIRTPMSAIVGHAALLREPEQSEDERLTSVDAIRRNSAHLLAVLDDVLDLSKVEAGELTVERSACSVAQVISDVVALVRPRAIEKGLGWSVELRTDVPRAILTDATRLRQILLNLAGNAVKFTEEGEIRLVASYVTTPRPRLRFEVIDTGIGLTDDEIARLFRPFAQADVSTTRRYGGTGLGLSICAHLAGLLDGEVRVSSVVGEGSTFTLELDAEVDDEVSLHRPVIESGARPGLLSRAAEAGLVGARVLVAEDSRDNRMLVGFILRRMGAEVTEADNGRVAHQLAMGAAGEGEPFHVILMDMQMPELDGYDAAALLRHDGYTGAIVAVTAHAMVGDREKCLASGCDDHVTKPIDAERLVTTVARWRSRGAAQTAA